MHIYIHDLRVHLDVEHSEGILVLHLEVLVGILNGLRDNAALHIPSIDKVVFKVPVPPGDKRFPDTAGYSDAPPLKIHLQQMGGDLSPVHVIDPIPQAAVSGGVQPGLAVVAELEGNLRVGQGQPGDQIPHMACLRHGGL